MSYPRAKSHKGFFTPDLPADTIYHIGVSGGKDSTAVLLWMIHESGISKENLDVTFCDTGNEHEWTYEQIALLNERVFPIKTLKPDLDFYELARKKKRFPSTKARFCTQHLKIIPSQKHITELLKSGKKVVAVSGVRADESEDRKTHLEWDFSNALLTLQWRPLLRWTIDDVYAIHRKYDVPLNKLYAAGAQRVGCFPCIMSRKAEIRNITLNFPERINLIRDAEQKTEAENGRYSSFFPRTTVPVRFRSKPFIKDGVPVLEEDGSVMMIATIDDVCKWSLTGKGAKGSHIDESKEPISCQSGFCE